MHEDEHHHRANGRTVVAALVALASVAAIGVAARAQSAPARAAVCDGIDAGPREHARSLQALGDPAREVLNRLATSSERADLLCGLAGLAALRDPAAVPPLLAAMRDPAFEDDRYRLARWAAFIAGGPDPTAGRGLVPLVALFENAAVWRTTGDDAILFLGELDDAGARDRLMAELARPGSDAGLDTAIHALARQADPRARERVAAIGQETLQSHAGNATFEQARRLGAVAFYHLTLGPETLAAGLDILGRLAPATREDTAAWAVQTLCEQAVRRPATREATLAHRARLIDALAAAAVRWEHLTRGAFPCVPPG